MRTLKPEARLHSLDVFRGITVFAMLLVNNPGDPEHVFGPLAHAEWHGCTIADLIFPFFLFIVGVSAHLSTTRSLASGALPEQIFRRGVKRGLILIALGILLFLFPFYIGSRWENVRIPGVLQRIGLVYLALVFALSFLRTRGRALLSVAILLGYYVLMVWIPFPGTTVWGQPSPLLEVNQNWAAWLDRLLLTGHLWPVTKTWDPEGLLSTIPAIVSGMLGLFAGEWLSKSTHFRERLRTLVPAGIMLIALGLAWKPFMPMNKNLWTSSYVLFTGGSACLFLVLCLWACDELKLRKPFAVFHWFGVNPILAFLGSTMVARTTGLLIQLNTDQGSVPFQKFLYDHAFAPLFPAWPELASLAYGLSFMALFAVILNVLYRKRIFLKV